MTIPEYLDRPEIVSRDNLLEISIADFERWAGSLEKNMTQLIAGELGRRLQSDRVVTSPWESYRNNDFQVRINTERFDGKLSGEVVFQGTWSLLENNSKQEIERQRFILKEKTADNTYKGLVSALSELTARLAEQIADAISTRMHK